MATFFNGKNTCPVCMKEVRPVGVNGNMVKLNCECGLCEEEVQADVKVIKINAKEFKRKIFNELGRILDAVKSDMKPEYQFVFDEHGNVIFLDYSKYGAEYSSYSYRWIWHKQDHNGKKEWYLIPFPQFHPKSLDLLPHEMELAKRAYEDIVKWEKENAS